MARIILGSYVVRYPLGGYLAMVLQWMLGFHRLGHDVYFVEKSGWPNSCYDPLKGIMSDDCSYGIAVVSSLFSRFGLQDRWCFIDAQGNYHGLARELVQAAIKSADLFVDMARLEWEAEAAEAKLGVLVEGDPGVVQIKMEKAIAAGRAVPEYDFYYTAGRNVGTSKSTVPTAGKQWRFFFVPVAADIFPYQPAVGGPFTTVMTWRLKKPIQSNGATYGGKDIEFEKFIDLPRRTMVPLEVAVAGKDIPRQRLMDFGWRIQNAQDLTLSIDSYREYIRASRGEFSVAENIYVATHTGWFSERSAAYLASGRPVVLQETGFSDHLPCGRGLFAVRTVEEAAAAIEEINRAYERHSIWAREIAMEHLEATKVCGRFLSELGL